MDQMGEVEYAPGEPKGTPWHPHRGFETVTYIIDGTFEHQDSHGGGGVITNGDTQWMTAGSGLLHIETPPEELVVSGGLFHGIQLWVNLPASDKWAPPRYQDIRGGKVALLVLARRRRAGPGDRRRARRPRRARASRTRRSRSRTPRSPPAPTLTLPWRPDFNALVYVLAGNGHGRRRAAGRCGPASSPCSAPATSLHGRRRHHAGQPARRAGRAAPRRPADPRAGRRVRPVRHEHQGRAACRRSRTSRPAGSARSRPTALHAHSAVRGETGQDVAGRPGAASAQTSAAVSTTRRSLATCSS